MTTSEPRRTLHHIRDLRNVLPRKRFPAGAQDARPQASAGPTRALPLYEALAIGLGCNLGSLERYTRHADAENTRNGRDVR